MKYAGARWHAGRPGFAALALALALGLGACASMAAHTAQTFDRGSAPEAKFSKDVRGCEKEAEAHGKEHGYGPYDPTHGAYNRMFDACMKSNGYQQQPAPS
ncbi:MAG: hypothetical protein ABI537_03005 [Casimicrobiaceae bacterium]